MLGTETDGALTVLITDGSPTSCSGGRVPATHTKQLADEMYQSGLRFAVVLVGNPDPEAAALYPAAITATVTSLSDLRNVQVILDTL
jgi:ADP-heptose:LPS heptosyltransferase